VVQREKKKKEKEKGEGKFIIQPGEKELGQTGSLEPPETGGRSVSFTEGASAPDTPHSRRSVRKNRLKHQSTIRYRLEKEMTRKNEADTIGVCRDKATEDQDSERRG